MEENNTKNCSTVEKGREIKEKKSTRVSTACTGIDIINIRFELMLMIVFESAIHNGRLCEAGGDETLAPGRIAEFTLTQHVASCDWCSSLDGSVGFDTTLSLASTLSNSLTVSLLGKSLFSSSSSLCRNIVSCGTEAK
ncbi:hypothetical protein ACLKA7_014737 [Drosophila subpalustris]